VEWDKEGWDVLELALDEAKERAQRANSEADSCISSGGNIFAVDPHGHKSASGGPMYSWGLKCGGVSISVSRSQKYSGDCPNVFVNIGSVFLMAMGGLDNAWPVVRSMVEGFGGKIDVVKMTRVDVCVDMPGVSVVEFVEPFLQNRFVSRAHKSSFHKDGKRYTGFSIGTDIMLRVYDKLEEVSKKSETGKLDVLVNEVWGYLPEHATRVEFQVRSEKLRTFGIVTLEDYFDKRARLCSYLSGQWFRLTEEVPDSSNQANFECTQLWKYVWHYFMEWSCPYGGKPEPIKRVRTIRSDPEQMLKQAVGCLTSVAAMSGSYVMTAGELKKLCGRYILEVLKEEPDIYGKFESKRVRYQSRVPVALGCNEGDFRRRS
jgi:hypothetical protein